METVSQLKFALEAKGEANKPAFIHAIYLFHDICQGPQVSVCFANGISTAVHLFALYGLYIHSLSCCHSTFPHGNCALNSASLLKHRILPTVSECPHKLAA